MNASFKLHNPDDLEAEITLRATVRQFRNLEAILRDNPTPFMFPHGTLITSIAVVISAAAKHFDADSDSAE